MRVTWLSSSGACYSAKLRDADYFLSDLQPFRHLRIMFQFIFSLEDAGAPAAWWQRWLDNFSGTLEVERDVLAFRYGCDGDFKGGQSVTIGGESYVLYNGIGECELSQYREVEVAEGGGRRLIKWIDLRECTELVTDTGIIKITRRRGVKLNWPDELPHILKFLEALPDDEEVWTERSRQGG